MSRPKVDQICRITDTVTWTRVKDTEENKEVRVVIKITLFH